MNNTPHSLWSHLVMNQYRFIKILIFIVVISTIACNQEDIKDEITYIPIQEKCVVKIPEFKRMFQDLSEGHAYLDVAPGNKNYKGTSKYTVLEIRINKELGIKYIDTLVATIELACSPKTVFQTGFLGEKNEAIKQINKILEAIEIDYETSIVISIEQGAIIVTEPYGQNQLAGKLPLIQ